jgi:hypothetical protein
MLKRWGELRQVFVLKKGDQDFLSENERTALKVFDKVCKETAKRLANTNATRLETSQRAIGFGKFPKL